MIIKDGFAEQEKGYLIGFYIPDYSYLQHITALNNDKAELALIELSSKMDIEDKPCTYGTLHEMERCVKMGHSPIGKLIATHTWPNTMAKTP